MHAILFLLCNLHAADCTCCFPFSALTLFVWQQEGHLACRNLGVGLLVVMIGWGLACLIAPVATTTSITLSSNKNQNGDILLPANPGPPGKWLLK